MTRFGPGGGLVEPSRDEPRRHARSREASPSSGPVPATRVSSASREDSFERVLLGAPTNEVYTLAGGVGADAETLWVGTRVSGLLRVQETTWAPFDRASGLPGDQVFCFLEESRPGGTQGDLDRDERGRGGPRGRPGRDARPREGAPGLSGPVAGLCSGRRAAAGSLGQRRRVRALPVRRPPLERGRRRPVLPLRATPRSSSPSTTGRGRRNSGSGPRSRDSDASSAGRWSAYGVAEGLPSDSILSLLSTRGAAGRTVWVGTRGGGLAEIVGGRVVAVHDRRSGLPNNNVLSLAEVSRPDGRRELWVGTRGGVARRSARRRPELPGRSSRSRRSPALPNDNVFLVAPGRDGRVYLGTNRGVARLSLSAGGADFGGGRDVRDERGAPERRVQPGKPRRLRGARLGGHERGRGRSRPGPQGGPPAAPPSARRRDASRSSGATKPAGGELRLSPKERDVAFEFSLLAFHGESLVRYRSQLVGWEGAPSEWVSSHRREFTNLPPGRYTFRVWGRDADGSVSGPVEVRFEVTQSLVAAAGRARPLGVSRRGPRPRRDPRPGEDAAPAGGGAGGARPAADGRALGGARRGGGRDGEQEPLPRPHGPRGADAAERDPRLLGSSRRGDAGPRRRRPPPRPGEDPPGGRPPARPRHRGARPREDRGGKGRAAPDRSSTRHGSSARRRRSPGLS